MENKKLTLDETVSAREAAKTVMELFENMPESDILYYVGILRGMTIAANNPQITNTENMTA